MPIQTLGQKLNKRTVSIHNHRYNRMCEILIKERLDGKNE